MTKTEISDRISSRINADFAGTDVNKFRLSGPDSGMQTNMYGLWTEAGNYVSWSAVSAGYVPHTVDDMSVMAEAAAMGMEMGGEINITTDWSGASHHVVIGPTNDQRRTICGTSDDIFPRVVISAGFAGQGFRCEAGFYRDACSNLSMIRQLSGTSKTIRHTESMRPRINDLADQFRAMAGMWDATVDFAHQLAARQVETTDFLKRMYPLAESAGAAQVTKYRNRAEKIIGRIVRERSLIGFEGRVNDIETASLWELVNGVTGYIQHDQTRGNSDNPVSADRRAFLAIADKNSDKAWQIAETMVAA